jgi:hypothetical protein
MGERGKEKKRKERYEKRQTRHCLLHYADHKQGKAAAWSNIPIVDRGRAIQSIDRRVIELKEADVMIIGNGRRKNKNSSSPLPAFYNDCKQCWSKVFSSSF